MKKIFKFAAILTVAAFTLSTVASCSKDDKDEKEDVNPTPDPEPDPQPTDPVPVEGTSDWSVIGSLLGKSWDTDFVCAEENGAFVVKNVKLTTSDEIKFRFQKGWDVNRGINEPNVAAVIATGVPTKAVPNGGNIKVSEDGVYDLYYFADLECITFVKKGETPKSEDFNKGPVAQSWDYVLDIKDWHINSTFMFDEVSTPMKLNPNAISFQVKFYSNKWNQHKFQDKDENGYTLYCNRLGEFSNAAESQTVLLRFSNDGSADGQLCLNAGFLGLNQDQVTSGDAAYVWATGEWHVITITSDGTTLSVYDNSELIKSYTVSGLADEWKFARYDISMTWKEGSSDDDWPLRQAFNGYIAFTRVWSKALSAEEVAASLCDVDATSEGLEVYWAYNLESGSVIDNLASNKEFQLDFSKAWDGNGSKNNTSAYAEAGWTPVEDIENGTVCAE